MKKESRKERVELRMTNDEKQKLERDAVRCGVSVSAYVRRRLQNKAPRAKPPDEFWKLLDRLYALFETAPPETQAEIEKLILALQEAM